MLRRLRDDTLSLQWHKIMDLLWHLPKVEFYYFEIQLSQRLLFWLKECIVAGYFSKINMSESLLWCLSNMDFNYFENQLLHIRYLFFSSMHLLFLCHFANKNNVLESFGIFSKVGIQILRDNIVPCNISCSCFLKYKVAVYFLKSNNKSKTYLPECTHSKIEDIYN